MNQKQIEKHLRNVGTAAYDAEIKRLQAKDETALRKDLDIAVKEAIKDEIELLEQKGISLTDALLASSIDRLVEEVDEHKTKAGKNTVQQYYKGQISLFDEVLDVVVPLGANGGSNLDVTNDTERSMVGELNAGMLYRADKLRADNAIAVVEDLGQWRRGAYERWMPILLQHGDTIRKAHEKGLIK